MVIEPNRGAFVWKPTAKQTRDVFELRRDLEALILQKLISYPDLPERLRRHAPLNAPDRSTFYGGGERGYTDYPALETANAA